MTEKQERVKMLLNEITRAKDRIEAARRELATIGYRGLS